MKFGKVYMSKVIVLATSKGGTGKSTLTRSLAAHYFASGFSVGVIDADPQGSIINRHDFDGPLKDLKVLSNPEETIGNTIEELRDVCDIVIVDTGGFRNKTTIRALVKTDIAIIPMKPSADDVSGALETLSLINEINETPERSGNPIKCRMILTMTQHGTVIARHIRKELEDQKYPLLKTEMYLRVAYPEAAIKGLCPTVVDPEGAAARDISALIKELATEI